MKARHFESPGAFRAAVRIRAAAVQIGVAVLVALYLHGLLQLDGHGWRAFGLAVGVFAVGFTALNEFVQRRIEAGVVACLQAESVGTPDPGVLREGFSSAMSVPARMFGLAMSSWVLAAITIPAGMALQLGDLPTRAAAVIATASVAGGFLSCLAVYFVLKRAMGPLQNDWATALGDDAERSALFRRVPLALKLGVATSSVVLISVLFVVMLGYADARAPVERQATRLQQRFLSQLTERVSGPGDADLRIARDQARLLGLAHEILVVDVVTGEVVEGESMLSAPELEAVGGDALGNSTQLDSDAAFAWTRLTDRPELALVAVLPPGDLATDLRDLRARYAAVFLAALMVALAVAWLLANDVSRATTALSRRARRVAAGDLRADTVFESEDELGDLARDFERMVGSLRETLGEVLATAERVDAAGEAIATAGTSVFQATRDQMQGIEQVTGQVASIDRQVAGITESSQVLNGNVEEASSSILELGASGEELNQTASALSSQIDDVSGSIEQMILAVRQIAENTEGLADEVTETTTSMAEMAATMNEAERTAGETAQLSGQVVSLADGGREKVRLTIAGMDEIRESTDTVSQVIGGLGERVQEIGAIVDVIDDVADETNLLALNAAIIAAQAGDQGRAFSVVADEIKDLADRVLTSTKEIAGLIRSVQGESANAVRAIEQGTESVQSGVDLAAQAGVSLEEITSAARASGERIGAIVSSVREQARAAGHVSGLMDRVKGRVDEIRAAGTEQERGNEVIMRGSLVMRDVAQQTHRTTEEQSRGARQIRESVESVRDAVDRIHGALTEQSQACRSAVEFLQRVHERTTSNREAAQQMESATDQLKAQAQALRAGVGRFQVS